MLAARSQSYRPFTSSSANSQTRSLANSGMRAIRQRSVTCNAVRSVDVEEGKRLLDMEGYRFLDLRPAREYDSEHLTKPPRCSFNVPLYDAATAARFAETLAKQARPATKMLVACADGGEPSLRALDMLAEAGYSGAVMVEGGYAAWRKIFSTGGRRRPAGGGRWMPTGAEALKSGLPIPGVADRYEDNNPV